MINLHILLQLKIHSLCLLGAAALPPPILSLLLHLFIVIMDYFSYFALHELIDECIDDCRLHLQLLLNGVTAQLFGGRGFQELVLAQLLFYLGDLKVIFKLLRLVRTMYVVVLLQNL